MADSDLGSLIDLRLAAARKSGALHAVETRLEWVEQHGLRFPVRWLSSLSRKADLRKLQRRDPDRNPFLPWETELEICPLGPTHVALLNKFPVMSHHVLVITRQFVSQSAPLTSADFAAIATLLRDQGGLGFYNGGEIAGASQPHRHFQWVPADHAEYLPMLAELDRAAAHGRPAVVLFEFDHALERLPAEALRSDDGAALLETFQRLSRHLGISPAADPQPPYNLLLSARWMLLVARSHENCEGISINSLGFAGSLFVPDPTLIEVIRRRGPLGILADVGRR